MGETMTRHASLAEHERHHDNDNNPFFTGIGNVEWVAPEIEDMSHAEVRSMSAPLDHFNSQIIEAEGAVRKSKCGFSSIYVVSDIYGKASKIGMAKEPTARLAQLQTGNPGKLFIHRLFWLHGSLGEINSITTMAEKNAHASAERKYTRAVGEWFYCTPSQAHTVVEAELNFRHREGDISRFCAMTPSYPMWRA
jgi:hypothetical protein